MTAGVEVHAERVDPFEGASTPPTSTGPLPRPPPRSFVQEVVDRLNARRPGDGEAFRRLYPDDRALLVELIGGVTRHVGKRVRPALADVLHHGRTVRGVICEVAKADPYGRDENEGVG